VAKAQWIDGFGKDYAVYKRPQEDHPKLWYFSCNLIPNFLPSYYLSFSVS